MASIGEIITQLQQLTNTVTARVVAPLIILFLGIMIGKIVKNSISKIGKTIDLDAQAKNLLKQNLALKEFVAGSAAVVIYTVAVIWALYAAEILEPALILVLIFLGIFAAIATFLWLRDFLPNAYASRKVKKRTKKGKELKVAGVKGEIKKIRMLDTVIKCKEGTICIPNRTVAKAFR